MGKKKSGRSAAARRPSENRIAMTAITFVVCVLFAVLLLAGNSLRNEIRANDEIRLELTEQLRLENERTESIRALRDYYKSEDYQRQAAKEKLGLIEEGDIVFKRAG